MSIEIQSIKVYNEISKFNVEQDDSFYFHGQNLDNRSAICIEYYSEYTQDSCEVVYDEKAFSLTVTSTFNFDLPSNKVKNYNFGKDVISKLSHNNIYLDATSLGFPEILLLLHYIYEHLENTIVKMIYAEPLKYKLKDQDKVFNSEFDLTTEFNEFMKIPPYSLLIDSVSGSKAELVVFLGFENDRLSRIIENDEGAKYKTYTPILAVPAFVPGWENISLRRHYLELRNFNNILFAPANNPYEAQEVLTTIQHNSKLDNIVIAPIGTKPHALGAIVFLINSKKKGLNVGIVYDFPKKKENRTDGIGNIHEYTLGFTTS